MSEQHTTTILVGIDGSASSLHAGRLAGRLAARLHADVVAAHAVGLLEVWPEHPEDHTERNSHTHVREMAAGAWAGPIRLAGVEPRVVLRDGPPAQVLLDLADEYDADIIVVGTRGSGNAALYELGSTAARMTARSTRPVLVVPDSTTSEFSGLEYGHDCPIDHPHLADDFDGSLGPALLANGTTVVIVAAGPADLASVRSFYGALSETATYYRFFGIRPALPDSELLAAITSRLPDRLMLLAFLDSRLIGIGEYIANPLNPREAEVAFSVADDHHHEGVATLLLERLAMTASRCGLRTFTATVLPDNADMQLVFRTVGLPVTSRFDESGAVIDVTLDITDLHNLHEQAARRLRQATKTS